MKIMIINDSRAMRLFLEDIVNSYFGWQLIGSYSDASYALSVLENKKPDVILLDLEMPQMDGFTFLERLGNARKYPTIITSNYAIDGSEIVNDALALGAVDYIVPPPSNNKADFAKFQLLLRHKIIKASLKSNRYHLFSNNSESKPRIT
ncbi:response regulator [Nitrosopumilus sp.]|uniref:response regulator n=1 Tax=Nitrosopumilus sp. TaxID=2024843 RepID=UPI00247E8384|nr:response regulator [Nitrosopumilus sp.]MCV0409506.1 response regulator [Nitrosopumilus sp.]